MAVVVYAENWDGKFKKSTFESVSFGFDAAKKLDSELIAVVIGDVSDDDCKTLGTYGASKVIRYSDDQLKQYTTRPFAVVLAMAVEQAGAELLVLPHTFNGKSLAARTAAKLNAGIVTGVVEGITTNNGFTAKKSAFSGKGYTHVQINSDIKVLTVTTNSFGVHEHLVEAQVENAAANLDDSTFDVKIIDQEKITGKIPLTEAERVVSGGRGMKGPENWEMLEELADLLNAGTACSKPVSDMDWRPHSEHVGQTGITIGPNLYLAVGISGAIQHQAGVNTSKVIVVINKDPEAPFFKIADYGIVGDAFEVVPKLIEAAKDKLN